MGRTIIKKTEIRTERLVLRPYRAEDRERLVEMLRDPEITKTFMVPDYSDIGQYYALADKLIGFSRTEETAHLEYGIDLDETLIGMINDCGYDDESLEVGYAIDPAFWGKGYATEALKAVIGELREMGFRKVVAGFFEGNIASRRVMEKCGMRLNGNTDREEYRGQSITCFECEMELVNNEPEKVHEAVMMNDGEQHDMKWYRDRLDEIAQRSPVYSCCGDDCAVCPRYLAETEDELRQTAEFWYQVGWRDHVVTGDEIRCRGCGTRGSCSFMILPCMKEHGVTACNQCRQYPCEKISDMLRRSAVKAEECRACCKDDAQWRMLKRAFYEKEKNLEM